MFTPGHDLRKLGRGLASGCSALIVDWEDAVAERYKDDARRVSTAFYAGEGLIGDERETGGCRVGVRINPRHSVHFHADLRAVAPLRPSFVMLSKVERVADVEAAAELGIPLVVLIESATALERLAELVAVSPRVERLGFGALDFCADVRARWRPSGAALSYARARLVVVSRHAGLEAPLDSVYPELSDLEGLATEAALARELGFGGKMAVHPAQLQAIASAFAPSDGELRRAREILEAHREAERSGQAVFRLDGMLIDSPTLRWARQVLAEAGSG